MSKTLLLTRILLKTGSGQFSKRNANGKSRRNILLLIVMAIALIPVFFFIRMFTSIFYEALAAIDQQGVILGFALAALSMLIFVFGIFYILNVFYFSQDVEHLLPLPLRPVQILTAKFIVTLIYEYVLELYLLAPLLVTYGMMSGAGITYYVFAILVFLLLPLVPLILGSVIAMVMMRFTNIGKNKDFYRKVGGAAAVILALGLNLVIQRFSRSQVGAEQLQEMMKSGNNSLLDLTTRIFPIAKLGANALLHAASWDGLINLLLFLLITAAAYALFAALGTWFYFKGVMGMSEASAKKTTMTGEQFDRQTTQNSMLKSFIIKEFRILFRTPPFFINCVLMSFLLPFVLCIPLLTQPDLFGNLSSLSGSLMNSDSAGIVLAIGFAVFLFISSSNNTAPTAISREGQTLFVYKFLPVSYRYIILSKVIAAILLITLSIVLLTIVFSIIIKPPILLVLLLLIAAIPAMIFSALTGIMFDLKFPKLNWDNEQKAVKNNLNIVFNMLVGVLAAGITVFLTFYFKLSLTTLFVGILVVFGLLDLILYRMITTRGSRWFQQIKT